MTLAPRPTWTAGQRLKIFNANDGRCHVCTSKIWPGQKWVVEHPKARQLGGSDCIEEMKPAHVTCHAPKTAAETVIIRKADRQGKSLRGIKARPRQVIPGSKSSRFKRKIDGTVVLR